MTMNRRAFTRGTAALALSSPLMGLAGKPSEHPVAATTHGKVRGYRHKAVNIFKGVRYGADTAPTRFAKPRPPPLGRIRGTRPSTGRLLRNWEMWRMSAKIACS